MKHPTSGDHPGLPPLDRRTLEKRLHDYVSEPLDGNALDRLLVHYGELARWAGRINLIGPGTVEVAAERHFGESVAALPLLAGRRRAVDIGSGAGFPGLVLAAARPDLEVILVEARQRKWAFLEAVARKASLSCRVLNATVVAPLPADFPDETDVITLRALRLQGRVLGALAERVRPGGAFLLWTGEAGPAAPGGWVAARAVALPGPPGRRIQEYVR